MLTLTQEQLKNPYHKILIWGPPRRKKTRFIHSVCLASIPTGHKVIMYDWDHGAVSLGDVPPNTLIVKRFNNIRADKVGASEKQTPSMEAMSEFISDFNGLYDLPKEDQPFAVVIDSWTSFQSDGMLEFVLAKNAKDAMEIQHWGQLLSKGREVIHSGLAMPWHFIVIAHELTDKDETTGSINTLPNCYGKMAGEISSLFNEVFYAKEVLVNGKSEIRYSTAGEGLVKGVGSRSRVLPPLVEPTWQAIFEKQYPTT